MRQFRTFLAMALLLVLAGSAFASQVEIRLKDGSRWRGSVNDTVEIRFLQQGSTLTMQGKLMKVEDLYLQVDGTLAGQRVKRTIFRSDVVSMKTVTAGGGAATSDVADAGADAAVPGVPTVSAADKNSLGVFVLPLVGTVGEKMRHNEIKELAEYIDKNYGPGQIIVLEIESGGGLMIECEKIHHTIADIRKRHRVVSWIKEAISAAAATAANCNEIYFKTTGTLGAMTMFNGGTGRSAQGEELQQWLDMSGRWFEAGGRNKWIAWAMIDEVKMLSYDKDPVTGEITWYNDMSGEHVLSTNKTNLVFNARSALDCKFSDGTADTHEELAKLLHLPKWHEKSDYGRQIAKKWHDTVEIAQREIPLLNARYSYRGTGTGGKAVINSRIQVVRELIRWWDRAPNICLLSGVPPKEFLQEHLEDLRKQLARMN